MHLKTTLRKFLSIFAFTALLAGVGCDATDDTAFVADDVEILSATATTGITICFEKPDSWSTPWIWFDKGSDGSWETTVLAAAPGDMTKYRTVNGKDWYKKELPDATAVTFLFNKGDWSSKVTNKGADFKTTANVWITQTGAMTLTDPYDANPTGITVYCKKPSGWSTPNIYAWVGTSTQLTGAWPGVNMQAAPEEGTDWFKYTVTGQTAINLIFNNSANTSQKTADLTRNKVGWYKNSAWYDVNPEGDQPPVISISPNGGDFTGSTYNVTITMSGATTLSTRTWTRSINNGTPVVTTMTSNSTTINIGSFISDGQMIEISAYAKDANGLDTTSNVVTFRRLSTAGLTVYFKKPSDWGAPKVYGWLAPSTPLTGAWSGVTMAAATEEGSGWYKYTFTGQSSVNCIFNDGSKQTVDLVRSSKGFFKVTGTSNGKYIGTWYDANPDDTIAPTVSIVIPVENAVHAGTTTIAVDAQDNVAVAKVDFYYGGTLLGSSSTAPYSFSWDTLKSPRGTNTLVAKATDTAGNVGTSAPVTVTVNNPNVKPVANAGADKTAAVNTAVSFDGSASYDSDGTIKSYVWANGVGGTMTGAKPTFTYTAAGTYTVTLTVTDEDNASATDTMVVTVTDAKPGSSFSWDNVNAYFVITDRFYNGNTANDASYGRTKDYGGGLTAHVNTATFHGGDIAGLTAKLNANYFKDLGVNAIWVTAPYEQSHGFVGGGWNNGSATYPHYAYHGYYTLDWTAMDKNMGTVEEFRTFVKTAHAQGIRVIVDIVMNHTGYENIADAAEYGYGGTGLSVSSARSWIPSGGISGNWGSFSSLYKPANDSTWNKWWGSSWVRAGKYNTSTGGGGSGETDDVSFLPDVKNQINETANVGLAEILKTKWAMEASGYDSWIVPAAKNLRKDLGISPAEYQIRWLAAWVEEFGVDGFRVDTAKHVSVERWAQLKSACQTALTNWRLSTRSDGDAAKAWDESFWMTGEVWAHGLGKDAYFTTGKFDSLINFSFPKDKNTSTIGTTWASYASALNNGADGYNVLSYLNSHDARENYGWVTTDIAAGTCLLLSPGGVQIYYGDEVVRPLAGDMNYDKNQCTRSDYQWSAQNTTVLAHWNKLGTFRKNHIAVGAGSQTDLGNSTYGRVYNQNSITDKVVIKINASGSTSVNVSGIFSSGALVRNAYDGTTATVSGSYVTFTATNGVILIEQAQ